MFRSLTFPCLAHYTSYTVCQRSTYPHLFYYMYSICRFIVYAVITGERLHHCCISNYLCDISVSYLLCPTLLLDSMPCSLGSHKMKASALTTYAVPATALSILLTLAQYIPCTPACCVNLYCVLLSCHCLLLQFPWLQIGPLAVGKHPR